MDEYGKAFHALRKIAATCTACGGTGQVSDNQQTPATVDSMENIGRNAIDSAQAAGDTLKDLGNAAAGVANNAALQAKRGLNSGVAVAKDLGNAAAGEINNKFLQAKRGLNSGVAAAKDLGNAAAGEINNKFLQAKRGVNAALNSAPAQAVKQTAQEFAANPAGFVGEGLGTAARNAADTVSQAAGTVSDYATAAGRGIANTVNRGVGAAGRAYDQATDGIANGVVAAGQGIKNMWNGLKNSKFGQGIASGWGR